jgi:peptidyl-prolyl cis-trans isomerase D
MWRMKDKTLDHIDAEKVKKNFWVYVVLLSALGAMTFFGVCDPSSLRGPGTAMVKGSAAVVEGEVITKNEFSREYNELAEQYQRMYQEAFDPGALKLAQMTLRKLVDDRAMYLNAVNLGMKASDDEVLHTLTAQKAFRGEDGKFNEEFYQNYLRQSGFTEAAFLENVRRELTLAKFRRFVAETSFVSSKAAELEYKLSETKIDVEYLKFDPLKVEVTVTPADVDKFLATEDGKKRVKEYFDANPSEFNQPEQLRGRHILVSYKGARNATAEVQGRDKEQAKARAAEVLAKAKAPGQDFAALAKEMTDEAAGKTSGGDLKWFSREGMDKAFTDAAFKVEPGQVSDVVETPFGFHVIKIEEKKAAVSTKLADAEKKIAETILLKEKRPQVAKEQADKVLAALKAGSGVDALLAEYKVAWTATGELAADARFLPGIGSSKEVGDALATLTKPGQLYDKAVDVRGSQFVLRLKGRKDADLAGFDAEKRKELAASAAYSDGSTLVGAYEKQLHADLEKQKKVWMNPDYLALDERRAAQSEDQGQGGG